MKWIGGNEPKPRLSLRPVTGARCGPSIPAACGEAGQVPISSGMHQDFATLTSSHARPTKSRGH